MSFPSIKLSVENMRYEIVHVLARHNTEIEKQVDSVLKDSLSKFDFAEVIKRELPIVLDDAIKSALSVVIHKIFESKDVKCALRIAVEKSLLKSLNFKNEKIKEYNTFI
jgi:hypothetical protein